VNRGDVWLVDLPGGRHPAVILTRDTAIPVLTNVVSAMITSTIRGIPSEVPVGPEIGIDHASVVNCDNIFTVRKRLFSQRLGELGPGALQALDEALSIALGINS
jgi:mRNA interferase MazF